MWKQIKGPYKTGTNLETIKMRKKTSCSYQFYPRGSYGNQSKINVRERNNGNKNVTSKKGANFQYFILNTNNCNLIC